MGGGGGGVADHLRPDTKSGGGGWGGGCPFKARYEKRGGASASGPIQKAGKGKGLFCRRGGVTIYERGGCNPQTPPPPGSASADNHTFLAVYKDHTITIKRPSTVVLIKLAREKKKKNGTRVVVSSRTSLSMLWGLVRPDKCSTAVTIHGRLYARYHHLPLMDFFLCRTKCFTSPRSSTTVRITFPIGTQ